MFVRNPLIFFLNNATLMLNIYTLRLLEAKELL